MYLPLRTFEKLKINTASGGVEVGEVSAEQFSLNTASGNIDISAYFNDVKLQSASGSIKLTNPLADPRKSRSRPFLLIRKRPLRQSTFQSR